MNFPDDGWEDYLHYGRVLTEEEHKLLQEDFLRRLKGENHMDISCTREGRLKYLEMLKEKYL